MAPTPPRHCPSQSSSRCLSLCFTGTFLRSRWVSRTGTTGRTGIQRCQALVLGVPGGLLPSLPWERIFCELAEETEENMPGGGIRSIRARIRIFAPLVAFPA